VGEEGLDREVLAIGWTSSVIELGCTLLAAYAERANLETTADRGAQLRPRQLLHELTTAANEIGEPRAQVAVAWNGAIMAARSGDVIAAKELFGRALAVHAAGLNDRRGLARLRSAMGEELIKAGPEQAESLYSTLLQAHEDLADSAASAVDLGYNSLALARADLVRGDPHQAIDRATEVIKSMDGMAALVSAHAAEVLAEAYADLDEALEAARALVLAAEHWEGMGAPEKAARAWAKVSELRIRGGDLAGGQAALDRAMLMAVV
jgi:hypothetical protein